MPQDLIRVSPSAGAFFLQSPMDQDHDGPAAAGAAEFQLYNVPSPGAKIFEAAPC